MLICCCTNYSTKYSLFSLLPDIKNSMLICTFLKSHNDNKDIVKNVFINMMLNFIQYYREKQIQHAKTSVLRIFVKKIA